MMFFPPIDQLLKWMKRVLPSHSDDREHVVYWIFDETCSRPGDNGYVGVTISSREKARILEHRRSGRFPDNAQIKILTRGNAEACYSYEAILRPHAMIGWNIAAGGARGNKSGIPKSEETKKKIGAANKGNKRPDLAERNKLFKPRHHPLSCVGCKEEVKFSMLIRAHRKCFKEHYAHERHT